MTPHDWRPARLIHGEPDRGSGFVCRACGCWWVGYGTVGGCLVGETTAQRHARLVAHYREQWARTFPSVPCPHDDDAILRIEGADRG